MPRPLPDVLLEEVLRRLPPQEPADLVRAALVSKRWCRIVSDPGFRRRFREFHRSPPMLGIVCYIYDQTDETDKARFIPTTAFCTPRTDFRGMRVLDARHGRVLFEKGYSVLAVWDPITNEVRKIPFPEKRGLYCWKAAILCSTASPCDHLDCHRGPFMVVFVSNNKDGNVVVYTYSSDAASWSELVIGQDPILSFSTGSALVGNAVYFQCYDQTGNKTLKYNFELRQMSMIQLPSSVSVVSVPESLLLTTMEDGGLCLINQDDSKLHLWSRKDANVDAIWERRVTIELNTVFPIDVDVTKLGMIGSGAGIIFMRAGFEVYTIDLKTYEVKKVYKDMTYNATSYMSFYTPALEAACSGEEPGAGGSSA